MPKKINVLEAIVEKHFFHSPSESEHEFIVKKWEQVKPILKSKIMEKLDSLYSTTISHALKLLKECRGIGFSDDEIRDVYEQAISSDSSRLEHLAYFSHFVNVPLSTLQKKRAWNELFSLEWNEYTLEAMVSYLGKPELEQEQVNSVCNGYLGILAGEEKDKRKIDRLRGEDILKFLEITKGVPEWDVNLAQRAYDSQIWLLDNPFCNDRFKLLDDAGAKPVPEKIQGHYRSLIDKTQKENRGHGLEDSAVLRLEEEISLTFKRTSIEPDEETKKCLEEFYKKNLDGRNFSVMKKLSGTCKTKFGKDIFDSTYDNFLIDGHISGINFLANESGVSPNIKPESVQRAYSSLFSKGDFDSALNVYLFTDVTPETDKRIVSSGLRKFGVEMEKQLFRKTNEDQTIEWVYDNFPEQTSRFIKLRLKKLIKREEFVKASRFRSMGCAPEENYVIACEQGDWGMAKHLLKNHRESITKTYPEYACLEGDFP